MSGEGLIGSVWAIQLGEVRRPALIVADVEGSGLVSVCPLVGTGGVSGTWERELHIEGAGAGGPFAVRAEVGGRSFYVRVDHLHSVSRSRLAERLGSVSPEVVVKVRGVLRELLGLPSAGAA